MLITLSSDYIYVLAMLKTTPLMVTVGLSLTIPCALLGDTLWLHKNLPIEVLCGAALVVVAFAAVGLEDNGCTAGFSERAHRPAVIHTARESGNALPVTP
jgi:drug/metabolite transporter (DMT)-like permease